ncbi:GNAT family N-acetyltransferase [Marinicella litoralis]|uniref:Acetyltransferase (GNAT) family protein n=1 Tax=Marinicella litoralis TaxID=644220 RepID=A0A4R6XLR0_9GAMM|nr:GNAT family N-acetyltransferase [Marinicella litoralis]TDR20506.1 acetyltransferase (GNAT) family protein [Marinicella litoralis]
MNIIDQVKDKLHRHQERHSESGYRFVFADSIAFINANDWDWVAKHHSVFLSRRYLAAIEGCSPENTEQRYAMAYNQQNQPVVIVACQVAQIGGEQLTQESGKLTEKIRKSYQERVLVCGNLVSSGLHGVGFALNFDPEKAWRIAAEILYKIRRAEKLSGKIDFVMIKDIKKPLLKPSEVLERYSYRRIQTDPDMVLELGDAVSTFDDYLALLTTKYRGRIKKIIKTLEQAELRCEKLMLDESSDDKVHGLYLQVEAKSATRMATLPKGYFLALQQALGEDFCCYGITSSEGLVGFVSVVKDGKEAVAYYVGLDYQVNQKLPIYFRLLQLVVETAIDWGCEKVLFGRTALEPKASLGAEPVEEFVWARHRVPVVNFMIRKLFRNVPFDIAPERSVKKKQS